MGAESNFPLVHWVIVLTRSAGENLKLKSAIEDCLISKRAQIQHQNHTRPFSPPPPKPVEDGDADSEPLDIKDVEAAPLISSIEETHRVTFLEIPAIRFAETDVTPEHLCRAAFDCEWVVFTSPEAVCRFTQLVEEYMCDENMKKTPMYGPIRAWLTNNKLTNDDCTKIHSEYLSGDYQPRARVLRVAAIGEGTKQMLPQQWQDVCFLPPKADALTLGYALPFQPLPPPKHAKVKQAKGSGSSAQAQGPNVGAQNQGGSTTSGQGGGKKKKSKNSGGSGGGDDFSPLDDDDIPVEEFRLNRVLLPGSALQGDELQEVLHNRGFHTMKLATYTTVGVSSDGKTLPCVRKLTPSPLLTGNQEGQSQSSATSPSDTAAGGSTSQGGNGSANGGSTGSNGGAAGTIAERRKEDV